MSLKNAFLIILAWGAVSAGYADNSAPDNAGSREPFALPPDPGGAILYSYPKEAASSDVYAVRINGTPCFVFPVPQTNQRQQGFMEPFFPHIAAFDIKGRVQVDITPSVAVRSVKIRPERAGIAHAKRGNTITIALDKPQLLSVEINGDVENPLLIFASEPETEIPDKLDPNVLFYEAGKIHDIGRPTLSSNQTVYIAPGAICYGAFRGREYESNIRIMGRGILSGAKQLSENKPPLQLGQLTNVTVEGITVVDSKNWAIPLLACKNVAIRGVKIVSNTGFDDGIDIVGCQNVTVENCFIRTKDDCIAVKAGKHNITPVNNAFDVDSVVVRSCVIWNGKHGGGLEIGFELNAGVVQNVTFENIDLIHTENPGGMDEGAISIHNSGPAIVKNILYKNIRIEDPQRMLFHFAVLESDYTDPIPAKYGKIQNIRLEDIMVTSTRGPLHSAIAGKSCDENISLVSFKNITINGKRITSMLAPGLQSWGVNDFAVFTNAYTSSITLE